jgi:acetoacetyl-CoA synthetase
VPPRVKCNMDRILPQRVFTPSGETIARSQLTEFSDFCAARTGRSFADHAAFHCFSVAEFRCFWRLFLDWSGLLWEGEPEPVCTPDDVEHAFFFPNLRLGYAENLLPIAGPGDAARPALTACHEARETERLTRGELRERVARLGAALGKLGVSPGDRIVAIAHNNAEAVIAALAATALGASFSSVAPEMGAATVVQRLGQLAPKLLLCHCASAVAEPSSALAERIAEIAAALPSLAALVALDDAPAPPGLRIPVLRVSELIAASSDCAFSWPRLPFNHTSFILFSSGTTGSPKCLMHGAGGTLIEHVKEHRLHCDLRAGDKLFFQTSTAWMMWNWQLSALASGAEIVLYDGRITDPGRLWRIVAEEGVTVFGTSPAYLRLSSDAGYAPRREHRLDRLRALLSTGAILYDRQFDWVMTQVKPVPLQSISGGTDIIGCFLLGNPNLPVHRGELQCRSLGYDVATQLPADVRPGRAQGELVCRNPFPSRPLGLWGDADGSRFHAAYFSQNPGLWTHGDLVEFSPEGTARLHGRCDGVVNVNGIRIGPAEIYHVLNDVPEIGDAMALEQRIEGDPPRSRLVLLVVLKSGATLDGALALRIKKKLGQRASSAHVPEVIADVAELPVTHSGKLSERAARDAVEGRVAANREALRNPECLDAIRRHPAFRRPADESASGRSAAAQSSSMSIEQRLTAIWERVLQVAPIGPDDDFFELGGDSFRGLALFAEIGRLTGRRFPLAMIFHAPTIARLVALLRGENAEPAQSPLVPVRTAGTGRAFFMFHGFGGNVIDLARLLRSLRCDRPIYAVQAYGLDPAVIPDRRVEDMAGRYLGLLRSVQPSGPYAVAGFSFGGLIAYEVARLLAQQGETVEFVGLIDTHVHSFRNWLGTYANDAGRVLRKALVMRPRERLAYLRRVVMRWLANLPPPFGDRWYVPEPWMPPLPAHFARVAKGSAAALHAYRPGPYPARVSFFRAGSRTPLWADPLTIWRKVTTVDVYDTPGDHKTIIEEPNVQLLATLLDQCLDGKAIPTQRLDRAEPGAAETRRPVSCGKAAGEA